MVKKKPRQPTVTVRVLAEVHHKLDVLSAKERRSLQDVVNEALTDYLKKRGA